MLRRTPTVGLERRRQVELVGRHLEHVDAPACVSARATGRRADVAADRDVAAGRRQDVGDQRRGGRLAVGAGDGDERRVRRVRRALAAEQLDVADDLDARRRCALSTVQCGSGWVSGTPGDSTSAAKLRPVGAAQIDDGEALGLRAPRRVLGGVVVPGGDHARRRRPSARARWRRPRCRRGRTRRPSWPAKARDRDHRDLIAASASARPTSASITAMIQKRITICGSVQPSCSKWWWIGAIGRRACR